MRRAMPPRPVFLADTFALAALATLTFACEENKYDKYKTPADAAASATAMALPPPSAAAASTPPAPALPKKSAADCKPHPASIDFGDDTALENEVRRKLGKDAGTIAPADLAQIRSLNLASAKVRQIDPCIYPMFASLKDLFLGSGDYDDLSPLTKLTTLEALRVSLSHVKDLRPIEGLKRLDRLDVSHTQVGDDELKSVGQLANLTELMLDETRVTDLTPVSNLKKLERLSIKQTGVQSVAALAQLRGLKFLYIFGTSQLSDLSPILPLQSGGLKVITTEK